VPSVEETNKEKATIASTKTGPELDRILINDLSRQLASYLDQCAIYGGGLINVPWVPQNVAIDLAICTPQILDPVAGAKASRRPLCVSIATGSRRSKTQKLFRFGHFGIPFL